MYKEMRTKDKRIAELEKQLLLERANNQKMMLQMLEMQNDVNRGSAKIVELKQETAGLRSQLVARDRDLEVLVGALDVEPGDEGGAAAQRVVARRGVAPDERAREGRRRGRWKQRRHGSRRAFVGGDGGEEREGTGETDERGRDGDDEPRRRRRRRVGVSSRG